MLRATIVGLALAACAAAPASTLEPPAAADHDPIWNRVDWDGLRGVQLLLGNRRYADALRLIEVLPQEGMSPPERMWLGIYRGMSLDGVGRRADAVQAYRSAAEIHPHGVIDVGLREPVLRLRHLDRIAHGTP